MAFLTLDVKEWVQQNFGSCDLGDQRRTQRAMKVAEQMLERPDGSTPDQCECWGDLKGAYRLFNCEDHVTFEALAEPHWRLTRSQARGRVLLLGDTTETDFGIHRDVEGLGPTGDSRGRGFLLHNSLMVTADTGEIIGLAGQELFYRIPAPAGENSYQALQRQRESEVWGRVIDLVGPPATGVQYVHVFDRGADNVEVFCHLGEQRSDWVIRAAQLHRKVYDDEGKKISVRQLLARQPVLGTYKLKVKATADQPARTALLEVRSVRAELRRSKRRTKYLKKLVLRN